MIHLPFLFNRRLMLGFAQVAGCFMVSAGAYAFSLNAPQLPEGQPLPNTQVFNGFGCQGGNQSPALHWDNPPPGTQSFAITLHDPDAPTDSGWWHWLVFDVPAHVRALPAGAGDKSRKHLPPSSQQGITDFGEAAYGGACPPKGDKAHRYVFKLHALKVRTLEAPANASAAYISFLINKNSLATAQLERVYSH